MKDNTEQSREQRKKQEALWEKERHEHFVRWVANHKDKDNILRRLKKSKSPAYYEKVTRDIELLPGITGHIPVLNVAPLKEKKNQSKDEKRSSDFRRKRMLQRIEDDNKRNAMST